MPKPLLSEPRSDFSGGLNSANNPDALAPSELLAAENVRLEVRFGAISKRTGSRRLHPSALAGGAEIKGLTQWDSPSGSQIVAIAGGNLYHKLRDPDQFASFTEVTPSAGDEFSTTDPAYLVPFRSTSSGAALELFIASGGKLYKWTGSTLSRIDGTNNAPQASLLASYHTRLFGVDSRFLKNLRASAVGDGTDWTIDATDITSGVDAVIDTLTGEAVIALGVVGSSLVVATEDSLVRFTGYASDDIRIEQDTEGISASHGVVGGLALAPIEEFLATLTAEGPYLVEEAGVQAIGLKVEPDFDALDRTSLGDAVLVYHKGRRELWVAVERSGDSGNQTIYCWNMRLQAWAGPWSYPFAVSALARYEGPNGDEFVMAGCEDGFVRHMDTGSQDDVLSDGTGGSGYELLAELAPYHFEPGPAVRKALYRAVVNFDAAGSTDLDLETREDGAAFASQATKAGGGVGTIVSRRFDLSGHFNRLVIRLRDGGADDIPVIHGLQVFAHNLNRLVA